MSRRMSRHAVRTIVAVVAISLAVLSQSVQAQETSSAQELVDLRALAEAGDTEAQYNLGLRLYCASVCSAPGPVDQTPRD